MYPWMFDEFKHIGVDFADPEQVKTYDARQQTNIEAEKHLVQQLGLQPGDTVIEFGPGTGAFAFAAAAAGAHVYAVDISRAMLDYGRSRAESAGLNTIEFIHSGFLSYGHQGKPADFIVTKFAFHHLPDFWKGVALRQMYAMLRAGGTLYLQDVVFSFPADEAAQHLQAWMDAMEREGSFSRADFEMHIRDEYSTFGWILEGLLREAGFEITSANYYAPTYAEYHCTRL